MKNGAKWHALDLQTLWELSGEGIFSWLKASDRWIRKIQAQAYFSSIQTMIQN